MIFILMIKFLRKNILCVCIRTPIPKKKKNNNKKNIGGNGKLKKFPGFFF